MKKKINWTVKDAPQPTRHGNAKTFTLRFPLDIQLETGKASVVDLGICCDHPVQLFECKSMVDMGVRVVKENLAIYDEQTPLTAVVRNDSKNNVFFSRGESVVRAYILDSSNIITQE